jgi:ABC-2 type transport system permease protein
MALALQPMVFLSGAIFPLQNLPGWLALPCRLNPATYGVDLARRTLLGEDVALTIHNHVVPIWADVAIVVGLAVTLLAAATRLFGHVD